MSVKYRLLNWMALLALLVYLAVLAKYIVFKRDSVRYYKNYFAREYKRYSVKKGWKKANTVPFQTINMYYKGHQRNNKTATFNLLGNLLGFIPFGMLLPLAISWFRRLVPMLSAIVVLSLGFETVQLVTGLGIFDVDDLLLNTTGSLLGYILFCIARLFTGKQSTSRKLNQLPAG
jgi:glycopeptide antibiotics resistance protein